MRFGIIGAMDSEIEFLTAGIECTKETYKNLTFYKGKSGSNEVIIVKSGIGKVCAAVAAVLLIERFCCDAVINTGVAGGIYQGAKTGDQVIASKVAHHDVNLTQFGYEIGQIPGRPAAFLCDEKMVSLAEEYSKERTFTGLVLSGEMFVSSDKMVQKIKENFEDPLAVEMEGAAVAQVCHDFKVPFLILRAVSDGADDNAATTFEEFEIAAAKRTSKLVINVISSYTRS